MYLILSRLNDICTYPLLRFLKECECDKDISKYKSDIQKQLENYYDQAVKDGISVLRDPHIR